MKVYGTGNTGYGLEKHGIENVKAVYWNLPTALLYEEAVRRGEGRLGSHGPLIVHTGKHTGRSPNDKFIVREPSSADQVDWGKVNRAIEPEHFDSIRKRMMAYLQGKELFVQDCYAGADPEVFAVLADRAYGKLTQKVEIPGIENLPEALAEARARKNALESKRDGS